GTGARRRRGHEGALRRPRRGRQQRRLRVPGRSRGGHRRRGARDVRRADLRRVERAAGGAARVQGEPRWAHPQRLLDPRIDLLPRLGLYCAGKYALEGLTDSLAAEVADFGIAVNLIEPGYMRTDFLGPQSLGLPSATVDAYPAIREMTDAHLGMPGTQLGDPARAAAALIAVATGADAPLHQLLGSDSLELADARVKALTADIEAARALAVSTDIPPR